MTSNTPSPLLLYNPELLSRTDLLRSFVARVPLLNQLLDDVRHETGTGAPQHHLLIGQRGTGKTTLLRRIALGIQDDPVLREKWQPVLFPEEQYNVTDLTGFWLNCVDALGDELDRSGQPSAAETLDAEVEKMPADRDKRRAAALNLLTNTAERIGKRLALFVDNIDLVFERIGKDQEWEFRRALQEEHQVLLIGASSRALEQTYEHGRAFYDFFSIHELHGLTDDETIAVLTALAEQHGAIAIRDMLAENPTRIRAMRLLTGGNPRTVVLLFKALLQNPDGILETDLEQILDQYTPLYKARLEDLPPQAQVLVDAAAVNWDPITAGDLAERVALPVNTVSAQLQRLVVIGVIEKVSWFPEKKIAFQIAERFFNIWYLMRASRRVRRRLIWLVKFLEIWFNEQELRQRAKDHLATEPGPRLDFADRSFAYAEAIGRGPLRTRLQHAALHAYLEDDELRKLIDFSDLPPELQEKKDRMDLLRRLREVVINTDFSSAGVDARQLWELLGGSPQYSLAEKERIVTGLRAFTPDKVQELFEVVRRAKSRLLTVHVRDQTAVQKLYEQIAIGDIDGAFDWAGVRAAADSPECRLLPLIAINSRLSRPLAATPLDEAELQAAESMLRAMTTDDCCPACGWHGLGNLYKDHLNNLDLAEAAYLKAIEIEPRFSWARNALGNLLWRRERLAEARVQYEAALEIAPHFAWAWTNLGSLLLRMERFADAEAACRKAVELDPACAEFWDNLGDALQMTKGNAEAREAYLRAIHLDPKSIPPRVLWAAYLLLKSCSTRQSVRIRTHLQ